MKNEHQKYFINIYSITTQNASVFGNKNTAHSVLVCMCTCTPRHTISVSIVKLLCTVSFKVVREASGGTVQLSARSSQTYVHI